MSPPRGKVPRMSDLPKESQIITRAPTSAIELWARAAKRYATRKRWPRPDRSLSRWVREMLMDAAERELGAYDQEDK